MAKTSSYYKKNPKAAAKRRKQQAKYNKTPKGLAIRVNANKLNKKLGNDYVIYSPKLIVQTYKNNKTIILTRFLIKGIYIFRTVAASWKLAP